MAYPSRLQTIPLGQQQPFSARERQIRGRIALFLLLLSSVFGLLADPLFRAVGAAEVAYALFLAMPLLATMVYRESVSAKRDQRILVVIAIYFVVMLLSSLVGVWEGSSATSTFRTLAPLIIPIFAWGIVFPNTPTSILRLGFYSYVITGVLQVGFIFYLYMTHVAVNTWSDGDVVSRVTYFDLRPLQPYLLAALALGVAYMFRATSRLKLAMGLVLFGLTFLGVLFTQTRTFIIIAAMLLVAAPALALWSRAVDINTKRVIAIRLAILSGLGVIAALFALANASDSGLIGSIYGRFAGVLDRDDWFIAIQSMDLSSLQGILLGIGVGSTINYYGQEVSFVHDGFIYHLAFAGVLGLLAYTAFLGYIGYKLTHGFLRIGSPFVLAMTLTYYAMVAYTLTFAVYKWPTFNAMLGFFAVVAATMDLHSGPPRREIPRSRARRP